MACRRSARSLFFFARALLIFLSKACASLRSLHQWSSMANTEAHQQMCGLCKICLAHILSSTGRSWTDLSLLRRGS